MKSQIIVLAVLFGMVLAAGSARADVMLPTSFPAGVTQYQIAFVTSGTTTGTNGYETYYNGFVQAQAASLTAMLPLGTSWNAITSTYSDGISAINNAPTYANTPIYNTAGQEVAANGAGLWSGTLMNAIQYDQVGDYLPASPWTGTNPDGTSDSPLGDFLATCGASTQTDSVWCNYYVQSTGGGASVSVYALSTPIPVPEPATITFLFSALLGLAGAFHLRRR